MALLFQKDWETYQSKAWVGMPGNQPGHMFTKGVVSTPARNGVIPRPGYPVYYNATDGRWQVPGTDALTVNIQGILVYRKRDKVGDDGTIEYADGTVVDIMLRGSVWVTAGATLNPMQKVNFDPSDGDWVAGTTPNVGAATDVTDASSATEINAAVDSVITATNAALANFGFTRVTNISPGAVSSGELFEAYLPGGVLL